jgi:hypothetical protein
MMDDDIDIIYKDGRKDGWVAAYMFRAGKTGQATVYHSQFSILNSNTSLSLIA